MPMHRIVRLDLYLCRLNDCRPANGPNDADYKCLKQCSLRTRRIIKGFFSLCPRCTISQVFKIKSLDAIFDDNYDNLIYPKIHWFYSLV